MATPKVETRPFRLYNATAKESVAMRWRYYVHKRNAHIGALVEARWAKVGTTIEVVDIRNGKVDGSYTRHVNHIGYRGGDNA